MEIKESYNLWSGTYDNDHNSTRDLEAVALRETLSGMQFQTCLELGCGTGKNTLFLKSIAKRVIAVDFSDKMLEKAKEKFPDNSVQFIATDILANWDFLANEVDLIVCSLVLEHIENVTPIFEKAFGTLAPGGCLYVGELHPYKQYIGSHARFENESGKISLKCFTHHLSDFTNAANENGFEITAVKEFFDQNQPREIPRILTFLFRKAPLGQ
ncbi:MAG TPA: class I SAM-dependent methyltransferase [Bacteroidales bacterium]|nr:class I SAM-dependent methyltransferase [Bacteroidales bacterium]